MKGIVLAGRPIEFPSRDQADPRRRMLAETEAFLNWAWWRDDVPRIPRRRVAEGGFSHLARLPGGRAMVGRWWRGTLEKLQF